MLVESMGCSPHPKNLFPTAFLEKPLNTAKFLKAVQNALAEPKSRGLASIHARTW